MPLVGEKPDVGQQRRDRDGDPDLVTGLANRPIVSANDGFGNFRRLDLDTLPSDGLSVDLGCGDLNLDGWNDLVDRSFKYSSTGAT